MQILPNFFRVDFSPFKDFLDELEVGPLSDEQIMTLSAALGEYDPTDSQGQWVPAGDGLTSLQNAEVIYIGDNDTMLPTNPLFKRVVGIRLQDLEGQDSRRLYMHYGN
jgi:hypothetical protein